MKKMILKKLFGAKDYVPLPPKATEDTWGKIQVYNLPQHQLDRYKSAEQDRKKNGYR